MKLMIRSLTVAGVFIVVAGVQQASAQIMTELEFKTDFPFIVGNTTVPAGSYTVRPDDSDPQVLEMSGPRVAVTFLTDRTEPNPPSSKTEVVFHRYGNSYVLKQLLVADSDVGYETEPTAREKRLAAGGPSRDHLHVTARKKGGAERAASKETQATGTSGKSKKASPPATGSGIQ